MSTNISQYGKSKTGIVSVLVYLSFVALNAIGGITPLSRVPNWRQLDSYQQSITREDFLTVLKLYAPGDTAAPWIVVGENAARIARGDGGFYDLRFAPNRTAQKATPRYWRTPAEIHAGRTRYPARPLHGVRIVLDPGHIGGNWAKVEERYFRVGNSSPVTEGDMTLLVAKKLAAQLTRAGAEVSLTRSSPRPATWLRPWMLRGTARVSLAGQGKAQTSFAVNKEADRLFYRAAEISARARRVNERLRPDLVICLHFNAVAWGNPSAPSLSAERHLHFLVSGAWSRTELAYDDQRIEMLLKLLNRVSGEEIALATAITKPFAATSGLPPYSYTGDNAVRVGASPYVWARNLLANRLYRCPVVYAEPYIMNSHTDFARIQAGDYEGVRIVAGAARPSIYNEYANALAAGILARYAP